MTDILDRNVYFVREHVGMFKAANNYDIYDPESGKVYDSTMRGGRDDKLRMRGYIGMPMFGRTETFQPLRACTAAIRTMLAASTLQLEAGCD